MTFRFNRDTWRHLKDIVMSVAALACVALALIPLGSILIEAGSRGLQAISPGFFALTTGEGGIGNAIQGTLILIALTSLISLPVGVLTGIYLSEFGKNRVGFAIRSSSRCPSACSRESICPSSGRTGWASRSDSSSRS